MSGGREARLVSVGNVIVDLITTVPALPERGGDVLATGASTSPGGSFNTLVAATRQGLPAVYAGAIGEGPFGDRIRHDLATEGIEVLQLPTADQDSGYDVAIVDAGGERTFVTVFGAEATLTAGQLAGIRLRDGDLIHVSGYGLLPATNGVLLGPWIAGLSPQNVVLLDPGPLVLDIAPEIWRLAADRADWLSCNEREARLLTGIDDPAVAIAELVERSPGSHRPGVLLRLGADGCLIAHDGRIDHVAGFEVRAVDSNGAGDAHAGAFLAAIAAGLPPLEAARRANACAAIAVSRPGPATAATLDEVLALLAG